MFAIRQTDLRPSLGMFKRPGGRGRPPLHFVSGNVIQTAGRIISAPTEHSAHVLQKAGTSRTPSPTICSGRCYRIGREAEGGLPYISFPETFSKWLGRRGRRPLQIVSGNVFQMAGRIISAPTEQSAHVLQKAGTSRTPSPTICSGRCYQIGREAGGGLPYNL